MKNIIKFVHVLIYVTVFMAITAVGAYAEGYDDKTSGRNVIDLTGEWYFRAYKGNELDSITSITPEVYENWGTVQPCLGWWTADFDPSLGGTEYFSGYAWYVRTFEVPEDFPKEDLTLAVGYFDEANSVYVNGQLAGSNGMLFGKGSEDAGTYDGSNPWEDNCVYPLDSSVLEYGGENTIAVRMCNSSGGGGWYQGPVGIFSKEAYENLNSESSRLITDEYDSKSVGMKKEFRIYLPEGYDDPENEKRYPVLYMLHGINSTGKAFEIDGIDKVLDAAISEGKIDEIIVVMPDDTDKTSFWSGKCADMVLCDLIPYVDGKYRTLDDAKYRYIGGCSMGGAGAMMLGLFHPELFSGVISFYGALDYTSAIQDAKKLPPEYFDQYAIYMACGKQDIYSFYVAQDEMSRVLTEKGAEHRSIIEDGTHSSSFYLPRLAEAIGYVEGREKS